VSNGKISAYLVWCPVPTRWPALVEPLQRLVDVVADEHDAEVFRRVHRGLEVIRAPSGVNKRENSSPPGPSGVRGG
jgi:hypothetical protein